MALKTVISVGQIALRDAEPAANLEAARTIAAEASRRGSDLLLLPELWLSGFALDQADRLALGPADARWETLSALSRDAGVAIAGSVMAEEGGKTYNRFVVHGADGTLDASYDKVHLFAGMQEDRYLAAGDSLVVADLGFCKAGLAVCYDLRFPELFRALSRGGAEVILLAAQWPHVRTEHWRTLLRARAIENQVYVIASNRAGPCDTGRYAGHSAIYDPWGEVVLEAGELPALLTAEIDLAKVREVREHFPVWSHVRPAVYGS